MYLIISRKGHIILKNYMIFLAKIYIHMLGGGEKQSELKIGRHKWGGGGVLQAYSLINAT
jgi:hypothetical protein